MHTKEYILTRTKNFLTSPKTSINMFIRDHCALCVYTTLCCLIFLEALVLEFLHGYWLIGTSTGLLLTFCAAKDQFIMQAGRTDLMDTYQLLSYHNTNMTYIKRD